MKRSLLIPIGVAMFGVGIALVPFAASAHDVGGPHPTPDCDDGHGRDNDQTNGENPHCDTTTSEAPTTTVEPSTTTEAPTTTVEPSTTTEAPTTTVEPSTTTEISSSTTLAPTAIVASPAAPASPVAPSGTFGPPSDELAHTGAATVPMTIMGGALALAGSAMVFVRKRFAA